MIYHIYYSSPGNSGLYLDRIYESLKGSIKQKLFVNHYYPFDYEDARRIFFKFSEKHENNNSLVVKSKLRKPIRLLEQYMGYLKIIFESIKDKPELINYSLNNLPGCLMLFRAMRLFNKQIKIAVTCHDVSEFKSTSFINYKKIYQYADYLIVHNEESKKLLMSAYHVKPQKIYQYGFPDMDISKLVTGNMSVGKEMNSDNADSIKKFLFIGVIREEKGLNYLIDAWTKIGDRPDYELHIAGRDPEQVNCDFEKISDYRNVILKIKRLTDQEYLQAINWADFVVFPYEKVGNSGVLSTVAKFNILPIVSDLDYFTNHDLVDKDFVFTACDSNALVEAIQKAHDLEEKQFLDKVGKRFSYLENIEKDYNLEVQKCYLEMLDASR